MADGEKFKFYILVFQYPIGVQHPFKHIVHGEMIAVAVIGDPDTAAGFRLAGVKEVYEYGTEEEEDIGRLLDKVTKEEIAIILINERFAANERTREKIREINAKKKGVVPIILEIPDKKGSMEKEFDEIARLIRRAVGVAVK